MSIIGMNSRADRKPPVSSQKIIIDRLKKVRKDYKIEENKKKEKILNEVFDLIDKL